MLDNWKLKDFTPGEGIVLKAYAVDYDIDDWIDVTVPGDVHQALIAAGCIKNPFYDRNELECAWVEEREWWYRTRLTYQQVPLEPDERLLLIFHGLDTFVTIWLNGHELGRHSNMFRLAVFDVSRRICTDGPNSLALCFHRPLDEVEEAKSPQWEGRPMPPRNLMRKAQFSYGWDWGPRLPTIGIWRPVELRRQQHAAIQGIQFATTEIDKQQDRALVLFKVEVERFNRYRKI